MAKLTYQSVIDKVAENGTVAFSREEVENISLSELAQEGIVAIGKEGKFVLSRFTEAVLPKKTAFVHGYVPPAFFGRLMADCLCTKNWTEFPSQNILFFGHAGTGKTECVEYLAEKLGGLPIVMVQGGPNQTVADFWGENTITVDKETKQNKIVFNKGVLYNAFVQGTKLDDDGFQILVNKDGERVYDGTGEPILVEGSKPAILFCDESSMTPEAVFTAAFNTAMCIPRVPGRGRIATVPTDNNRIIKSHPGMIMVFAANNNWIGQDTADTYGYTSQIGTKDASTRNRITSFYEFGYNKKAEDAIIAGNLQDDKATKQLLTFRDNIRKAYEEDSNIQTVFSTRHIVTIVNKAKLYLAAGLHKSTSEAVVAAIAYVIIPALFNEEKSGWIMNLNLAFNLPIPEEKENYMCVLRKKI